MRAAIFNGPRNIEYGERPDPVINAPTDAVVRVALGSVCGSDLWYYRGESPHALGPIGHEFIGVVTDVGSAVTGLAEGEFVVAPFTFSDGSCPHCLAGWTSNCANERIVATNLIGPIHLVRAALPHLRAQGGGRIIQISSYGGQVAFPGNSLYHATKWGIEGFVEAVAQEIAPFGIGMTIVEPGGARTEFRYRGAQVAELLPAYDGTPAHAFLRMLDPENGLAPGDPARMAARIIESADVEPAAMRIVLGSAALESTVATLRARIAAFEAQAELAASTDFPAGE